NIFVVAPGSCAASDSPRSRSTSTMVTVAPAAVSARQVASPIPLAPPVTRARRPSSRKGAGISNDCGTIRTRPASSKRNAPRYPVRPARDAKQPPLHHDGGALAGSRNWRQHVNLQFHGSDPAAIAAGERPATAGGFQLAFEGLSRGFAFLQR